MVAGGRRKEAVVRPCLARPFENQTGHEYQKHLAFREDHGLVDAQGKWAYSKELLGLEPAMRTRVKITPRMWDLLHIIWLLFERRGVQASRVNQTWMLLSPQRAPRSRGGRDYLLDHRG